MLCLTGACAGYNPAPSARRGGTLVVALRQDAQALNPLVAGDVWSVRALTPLYPHLYQAQADLSVTPDLASELPEISADRLTWTVRLRPARWSDGQAITSADVVYTVQTEMNPALDTSARFDWSALASVNPAGDHAVTFKLRRPDAGLLGDALLTPVVPQHALADVTPGSMGTALFTTQPPVAGGPFRLEHRTPGQSIDLTANRRYYGPQPYLDGVQLQVLGDPVLLADGLGQGNIGWAPDISAAEAAALRGVPNVSIRGFPELGRYALVFNERSGRPFAAEGARQQLAAALDRNRIAAAARGVAVWSGVNSRSWAFGPVWKAPLGAAPATAARLLYPLGDAARARAAAEIAREVPALKLEAVPPGEFTARLDAGDFDTALAGLGEGVDPDPAATAASWGVENFGGYADATVDRLVAQDLAQDPADHAARRPILDQLQRQIWADPPYVDLWTVDELDAFSGTVLGVGPVGPQLDQDLQSSFYARWSLTA